MLSKQLNFTQLMLLLGIDSSFLMPRRWKKTQERKT